MSIPVKKESTDVASQTSNPFLDYGEQASQRAISGTLLRFTKGDYLAGQEDEEVAIGTKYVANMDEMMVGWIRWEDNKPTDHVMGRIADRYQAPRRNELGDNDKAQWEVDNQGKERDPWQFSNYLVLWGVDDSELYTFATSSKGGLNALGDLSKLYGKQMAQHPNEFPIIELGVGSYNHPNKEFGRIKVPVFKIVGWETKGVFADGEVVEDEGAASAPSGSTPSGSAPTGSAPATAPDDTKAAAAPSTAAPATPAGNKGPTPASPAGASKPRF